MALLTLVTVGFISSSALAKQSGLCDDLASFTCSPGVYDDGTGISTLMDATDVNLNAQSEFKSWEPEIAADIKDLFKDAEIRTTAAEAIGTAHSPFCESQESDDQKKCENNLILALNDLVKKDIIYSSAKLVTSGIPRVYNITSGEENNSNLTAKQKLYLNPKYQKFLKKYEAKLDAAHASESVQKKISEKIFPRVKEVFIEKLTKLPIPEENKIEMIKKIQKIEYKGNDCSKKTGLQRNFQPNAFFDGRGFYMCNGYNQFTSDFSLAQVIAHEMAHSIGPCRFAVASGDLMKEEDSYPVYGLVACLRSKKSIAARRDTSPTSMGNPLYPLCYNDQMEESVADWFAVEIRTEYIEKNYADLTERQYQIGSANAGRILCFGGDSEEGFERHPAAKDRINNILLVHPKTRKRMGCSDLPKYSYCDVTNKELMKEFIAERKQQYLEENQNEEITPSGQIKSSEESINSKKASQ